MSVLATLSVLVSFKNYLTLPVLTTYSKSSFQNKNIMLLFFLKKAIRNNILLVIFAVFAFIELIKTKNYTHIILLAVIPIISFFLSFTIMYLKNKYLGIKINGIRVKKSVITPHIKSSFYDYFTGDFLLMITFCLALFFGIITQFLKNTNISQQIGEPFPVLVGSIIVLAFGFMGITSSIPDINWKFYSIVYPKNLSYHIKRSVLVLLAGFIPLIMAFFIIILPLDILTAIKYVYCLAAIMLFSIYNAFTLSHFITVILRFLIFSFLTIWVTTLHTGFLIILVVPIIFMAFITRNDYKERYFL
jgi:hypothetical protein